MLPEADLEFEVKKVELNFMFNSSSSDELF